MARMIVGSAVAGSMVLASYGLAAERDEALASSFLYCAYVSRVFVNVMSQPGANREGIEGFRQSMNLFRLAAVMKSDGEFLKANEPKAIEKVLLDVEAEKKGQGRMTDKARECHQLFVSKAVPVLKEKPASK
jgi:hypothetical protein